MKEDKKMEEEKNGDRMSKNRTEDTAGGKKKRERESERECELGYVQRYKAPVIYFGLPRPEPIPHALSIFLPLAFVPR